ncbi:MAG: hypothetical protein Q8R48_03960 [Candidatus Omnitrophota bacterium]|nr:hypothetical protein [Candidatus Omnitrophota bacterium]
MTINAFRGIIRSLGDFPWLKACLPAGREYILAKDNYSYKKYARELAKKKKKEEKAQRRLDKKNTQSDNEVKTTPVSPETELSGE